MYEIKDLLNIMAKLRDPEDGCNWDKKQTYQSITAHTIEEVYEPYLIKEGFMLRTPRGRMVTEKAYQHLGKNKIDRGSSGTLF